ncbi:type II 3-dehydroquinate dehydratase [Angustibacter luteus]|uniref:3-dehydroquinate dehydratase n=1 Tax=Angustibacter luteus TaxID=658456 RepID=A0ABW1JI36_9ACTN
MRIGVLHGSNLNRLGRRNPAKYGTHTLVDVAASIDDTGARLGFEARHVQSNHEGVLVDWVHTEMDDLDAVVVNPAGFTSVGYPLLDAIVDTALPFAVVHISPWFAMDGRNRADIFAPLATTYVTGAGWHGYRLACEALFHHVQDAAAVRPR